MFFTQKKKKKIKLRISKRETDLDELLNKFKSPNLILRSTSIELLMTESLNKGTKTQKKGNIYWNLSSKKRKAVTNHLLVNVQYFAKHAKIQ